MVKWGPKINKHNEGKYYLFIKISLKNTKFDEWSKEISLHDLTCDMFSSSECGEMTPQEVFDSMGTLGNMFDNQYNRRTDTRWMHKLLVDAGMEDQVRAILEEVRFALFV